MEGIRSRQRRLFFAKGAGSEALTGSQLRGHPSFREHGSVTNGARGPVEEGLSLGRKGRIPHFDHPRPAMALSGVKAARCRNGGTKKDRWLTGVSVGRVVL